MTRKLIDIATFRAEARAGKKPGNVAVFRVSAGQPKIFDDGTRRVRFCFSDGSVDRAGDRIEPEGWDIESFTKNPVALWAHNSWEPPIGRASAVGPEKGRLMGDIQFAAPEVYEFADTIYRLVGGGFINACSVGFLPLEWSYVDEEGRGYGMDFKRQELLEISVVPVPCNSNALAEARAKGIDTRPLVTWAEKVLDGGGKIIIPRAELDRLRKAAKEPPMRRRRTGKDGDGLSETDPASGGAVVGSCGRNKDEQCGMKNPEECSVHKSEVADDGKSLVRAFIAELRAELKRFPKRNGKTLKETAEGAAAGAEHAEPDGDDEHAETLRSAHAHVKAAGALYDAAAGYHEKAMGRLEKAVDHIGDPEAEGSDGEKAKVEDGEDGDESELHDHVKAAHAHMKAAEDLYDQATEHHDKAEGLLAKAVDHIDDPEAEGAKQEAIRIARAALRKQRKLEEDKT